MKGFKISLWALAFTIISIAFIACQQQNNASKHGESGKTEATTAPAPAKEGSVAAVYECPMKCEAPSDKPGKCGKCGMDLVKK